MKLLSKTKTIALIFYVIAAIYCIITIIDMVSAIQYLIVIYQSSASSEMYMQAQITFMDYIKYFFQAVCPSLFYTLVLFFCGYSIDLVSGRIKPAEKETAKVEETTTPVVADTTPVEDAPQSEKEQVISDYENSPTTDDDPENIEEKLEDFLESDANNNEIEEIELENEEDK